MGENIIVAGGRDWTDRKATFRFLDSLPPVSVVVTGGARGADALGDEWAMSRGIARAIFPANWDGEGRSAGHNRNDRMLRFCREIHRVVLFPGGRGTSSMREHAIRRGVKLTIYDPEIAEMLSDG